MTAKFYSRFSAVVCILAVFAMLAGVATAQEFRAKVQGVVLDPSAAAVANATVTLRNTDTAIETVRQTDSTGHYLFDLVQPGRYSITVVAPGFQKYVQENFTVLTRGDLTVNAILKVGEVTQSVEVTGEVSSFGV